MVPHMAWGRRSRIHLRSMSLARLRQPRCPVMATTHASLPGLAPAPASATTSARDLPSSPTTCSTSCLPSPKPLACALAEQDKAGMNRKVLLLSISFDGGCQSLCLPRCWMLVPSQAHHFAIVKDVGQLRPQHRNIHYMASGLSPLSEMLQESKYFEVQVASAEFAGGEEEVSFTSKVIRSESLQEPAL
ncbi:hypothetical protein PVAP13_4KG196701 [Panicum virgatum]|uniref:Uncharacterized protein n=1 Tax=Panicum virgatum TaxID=38727 RepID=A0A8T0TF73_PANVG|nr:hypothetical protein PVAP13_4KG196701 [Panicum virgatum]